MNTGEVIDFAINKSGLSASYTGEGGFERPIDVVFGPDNAMYILDFAVTPEGEPNDYYPRSGVIWRIIKNSHLCKYSMLKKVSYIYFLFILLIYDIWRNSERKGIMIFVKNPTKMIL